MMRNNIPSDECPRHLEKECCEECGNRSEWVSISPYNLCGPCQDNYENKKETNGASHTNETNKTKTNMR